MSHFYILFRNQNGVVSIPYFLIIAMKIKCSPNGLFTLPDTDLDPNLGMNVHPKNGTVAIGNQSMDWNPSLILCNVNMFCIVQCSHRFGN